MLSLMLLTPLWAPAIGVVSALVPDKKDLWPALAGEIQMSTYQKRYERKLSKKGEALAPGTLRFLRRKRSGDSLVETGDTLCCTCARAVAARGECHRVWAAPFLVAQGWLVVLDGSEVS